MREVGATGKSLVEALSVTADDLGLVELQQVAATTALLLAEGAPVARTLAAKCSTLRSTLATEQESEARLRTSRLTAPIVGMALIFMALVIYPALSFCDIARTATTLSTRCVNSRPSRKAPKMNDVTIVATPVSTRVRGAARIRRPSPTCGRRWRRWSDRSGVAGQCCGSSWPASASP